jgi:cell division protein FtsW
MKNKLLEQEIRNQPDYAILFSVLILAAFGLIMVFSASYISSLETRNDAFFFLRRQAFWVVLGLLGMFLAANFSYWKWRRLVPAHVNHKFCFTRRFFLSPVWEWR